MIGQFLSNKNEFTTMFILPKVLKLNKAIIIAATNAKLDGTSQDSLTACLPTSRARGVACCRRVRPAAGIQAWRYSTYGILAVARVAPTCLGLPKAGQSKFRCLMRTMQSVTRGHFRSILISLTSVVILYHIVLSLKYARRIA